MVLNLLPWLLGMESEIVRPEDLVVKSTGTNSINKLYIIKILTANYRLMILQKQKVLTMDANLKKWSKLYTRN
jgi:ATP-dependent DNA helicase RecQ